MGVHVVVAERLDDDPADDGSILFEEGITKPVHGAEDQVREEIADEESWEDEPGRSASGQSDDDADEEDRQQHARYGNPGNLKGDERIRLSGCLIHVRQY